MQCKEFCCYNYIYLTLLGVDLVYNRVFIRRHIQIRGRLLDRVVHQVDHISHLLARFVDHLVLLFAHLGADEPHDVLGEVLGALAPLEQRDELLALRVALVVPQLDTHPLQHRRRSRLIHHHLIRQPLLRRPLLL